MSDQPNQPKPQSQPTGAPAIPPEMPFCHTGRLVRGEVVEETFTVRGAAWSKFNDADILMQRAVAERQAYLRSQAKPAPARRPADKTHGEEEEEEEEENEERVPICPTCGSDCWDNRGEPARHDGKRHPLIKCKNPDCDYRVWPAKQPKGQARR